MKKWLPVDAEIMAALDDVATRLGRFGAEVVETQPEGFDFRTPSLFLIGK